LCIFVVVKGRETAK